MQNKYYRHLRMVGKRLWHHYYLKNWIECKRDRKLLGKVRKNSKDINKNPLISVRIPTYNRSKILTERAIPSVLRQTYQNFEIIVVGDHCTDNTEESIKNFNDNRIKFFNLPKRGSYPINPIDRWRVAGIVPANKGLELCTGDWIAPLDDDDEFSENHLEILLNYAVQNDFEMVYGIVQMEKKPGKWVNVGSYPINYGEICHLSVIKFQKMMASKYNYIYMPILLRSQLERDTVFLDLIKNDIKPRKYFYPLTVNYNYFKDRDENLVEKYHLSQAIEISNRILCLPLYPDLERDKIEKIIDIIRKVLI